uniref:rabenosyn-5 isoform X2 n=1 Tax=Myxine glutinosa TaxID=7769 RepID=UPI00358F626C
MSSSGGYIGGDETEEMVREGFLCPLCMRDFPSVYQLSAHWGDEHESKDVAQDLKSKAQDLLGRAKSKLLRKEGSCGENQDVSNVTASCAAGALSGVDLWMWEPQELGMTRSHTEEFKRIRAARIERFVIEMNKLIIRLGKLTAFDRTTLEPSKVKAMEREVVPWVSDQHVPLCPDCGSSFRVTSRRHHCRLCGSIMCSRCSRRLPLVLAHKLSSSASPTFTHEKTPGLAESVNTKSFRKGSSVSLASLSGLHEGPEEFGLRCCGHCEALLLRHECKMDQRSQEPVLSLLYRKLRENMKKVEQLAPEYVLMAESLSLGEPTYNLQDAGKARADIMKLYETIDVIGKKILTLGIKQENPPSTRMQNLHKMIRHAVNLFIQDKLRGLPSLPTPEKYEELKAERKRELEERILQERKQLENVRYFLQQAEVAGRRDEAAALCENLCLLQEENERRQKVNFDAASWREAAGKTQDSAVSDLDAATLRPPSLHLLQKGDIWWGVEGHRLGVKNHATAGLENKVNVHPSMPITDVSSNPFDNCDDDEADNTKRGVRKWGEENEQHFGGSLRSFAADMNENTEETQRTWKGKRCQVGNDGFAKNTFGQNRGVANTLRHRQQENSLTSGNPFEGDGWIDDCNEQEINVEKTSKGFPANDHEVRNPFLESETPGVVSLNPFDEEYGDVEEREVGGIFEGSRSGSAIEPSLLRQQIENIRAYLSDARRAGRNEEAALLFSHLHELQLALHKAEAT